MNRDSWLRSPEWLLFVSISLHLSTSSKEEVLSDVVFSMLFSICIVLFSASRSFLGFAGSPKQEHHGADSNMTREEQPRSMLKGLTWS